MMHGRIEMARKGLEAALTCFFRVISLSCCAPSSDTTAWNAKSRDENTNIMSEDALDAVIRATAVTPPTTQPQAGTEKATGQEEIASERESLASSGLGMVLTACLACSEVYLLAGLTHHAIKVVELARDIIAPLASAQVEYHAGLVAEALQAPKQAMVLVSPETETFVWHLQPISEMI